MHLSSRDGNGYSYMKYDGYKPYQASVWGLPPQGYAKEIFLITIRQSGCTFPYTPSCYPIWYPSMTYDMWVQSIYKLKHYLPVIQSHSFTLPATSPHTPVLTTFPSPLLDTHRITNFHVLSSTDPQCSCAMHAPMTCQSVVSLSCMTICSSCAMVCHHFLVLARAPVTQHRFCCQHEVITYVARGLGGGN